MKKRFRMDQSAQTYAFEIARSSVLTEKYYNGKYRYNLTYRNIPVMKNDMSVELTVEDVEKFIENFSYVKELTDGIKNPNNDDEPVVEYECHNVECKEGSFIFRYYKLIKKMILILDENTIILSEMKEREICDWIHFVNEYIASKDTNLNQTLDKLKDTKVYKYLMDNKQLWWQLSDNNPNAYARELRERILNYLIELANE